MRDGNAPTLARWLRDGTPPPARLGDRLVLADRRLPGGAAARQQLRHAGLPLVGEGPRTRRSSPTTRATPPSSSAATPNGAGLLYEDGASRANILSGDAPHTPADDEHRARRDRPGAASGRDYFAYFASPYNVAAHAVAPRLADIAQRALVRGAAAPPRRAPAHPSRAAVRAGARVGHGDPARSPGRGDHRRPLRRAAGGLHDLPRLRRGRPPLRHRAGRHAGHAAQRRSPDRPHRGRGTARAAPVPASWCCPITASPRAPPSSTATASRSRTS